TSSLGGVTALSWFGTVQQQVLFMKTKIIVGTIAAGFLATPLVIQQQTIAALRQEQSGYGAVRAGELETVQNDLEQRKRQLEEIAQLRRDHEELVKLQAE